LELRLFTEVVRVFSTLDSDLIVVNVRIRGLVDGGVRAIFKSPTRLRFICGYVHFGLRYKGELRKESRVGQRGLTERGVSHHRLCACNQANTDTARAAKGEGKSSVEEGGQFPLPSISFPNREREYQSRASRYSVSPNAGRLRTQTPPK
jgi:hypothetical protein